jgi:hypothetical protein
MAMQPDQQKAEGEQPPDMPRGHFPGTMGDTFRPPPPHDGMGGRDRGPGGRDHPPGDFLPHPRQRGGKKISQQDKKKLRAFVKEHFPRMHEELQRLRDRNPQRAKTRMVHMAAGFLHLMKTMERDPEKGSLMIRERRLDMRLRNMGRQYRRVTENARRDKLETKIRSLCAEAFDLRQSLREMGTRELEARVAELRDRHREASSMRDQLIDRAVRDHLEGPPGGGPRRGGSPQRRRGKP